MMNPTIRRGCSQTRLRQLYFRQPVLLPHRAKHDSPTACTHVRGIQYATVSRARACALHFVPLSSARRVV